MRLLLVSALLLLGACDADGISEPPSDVKLLLRPSDQALFVGEQLTLNLDSVASSHSGSPVAFRVTGGGTTVRAEVAGRKLEIEALRPGRETLDLRIETLDTLHIPFDVEVQEGALRSTHALADTTLYARRDTLRFDLSKYFGHRDGGPIQFQATSSSSQVHVALDGTVLSLSARSEAQSVVSVVARSDGTPALTATFAVRARADWCGPTTQRFAFRPGIAQRYRTTYSATSIPHLPLVLTKTFDGEVTLTPTQIVCQFGEATISLTEHRAGTVDSTLTDHTTSPPLVTTTTHPVDETRSVTLTLPPFSLGVDIGEVTTRPECTYAPAEETPETRSFACAVTGSALVSGSATLVFRREGGLERFDAFYSNTAGPFGIGYQHTSERLR